ncbi:hypothetical protein TVAG_337200 [Trichomonas vaginalis G3]|uniref:Uncharacterized protein n=1 Tax=Trichomonas vaginalis (strain ATCC PRA-98 / G3) TaxID=412133 RepID=A2FS08_TRIV3|nr:hypothetical protein TVAGG3_0187860 [Trichomonas vaginalis G3]EAX92300.1 hypothetical protein TVAG_337200 [Trichomonas vaginalis G3]KAI5549766.1 hypothetical protein TVAGG3_0187860 [Trichomonas vaginalis G3]|eukprot:XP_001305230.1 hypothetical protein [Trichomonas vaginalis G3]
MSSTFEIANRHYSDYCRIVISSNSAAFKLSKNIIEIPPTSIAKLTIQYDERYPIDNEPEITLVCQKFGIKISRILTLQKSKSKLTINFGTIATGTTFYKECKMKIDEKSQLNLQYPFNYTVVSGVYIFSFHPTEEGQFSQEIELGEISLLLLGKSVKSQIEFDSKRFIISNTTEKALKLTLKSLSKEIKLNNSIFEIDPKGITKLDLNITSNKAEKGLLIAKYNGIKQIITFDVKKYKNQYETEHLASKIDISPEMIIIPAVDQNSNAIPIIIKSNGNFTVKGPKWLEFPSSIEPNEEFSVNCRDFQREICLSRIIVCSENLKEIPILAYKGKSSVRAEEKVELFYSGEDQYEGEIEITNEGDRSMFCILTALDEHPGYDINISQSSAVIKKFSSLKFTFIVKVTDKNTKEFDIPILLYTGDEIIRQIKALLNPNCFFSEIFKGLQIDDELGKFSKKILNFDKKYFNKIFKDMVFVNELTLFTRQNDNLSTILVSPTNLVMNPNKTSNLTLINTSQNRVYFEAKCVSDVKLSNQKGFIESYSELNLQVFCQKQIDSEIEIITQNDRIRVPVSFKTISISNLKSFSISSNIVDFGVCKVLKKKISEFQITNLTGKKIDLFIKSFKKSHVRESVFDYDKYISLSPLAIVEINLEFTPSFQSQFEECVEIVNQDDRESCILKLVGNGIK